METDDAARLRFAMKERAFALMSAQDTFPVHNCPKCKAKDGCCESAWHHVGDCCIHCGNDEREEFRKLEAK